MSPALVVKVSGLSWVAATALSTIWCNPGQQLCALSTCAWLMLQSGTQETWVIKNKYLRQRIFRLLQIRLPGIGCCHAICATIDLSKLGRILFQSVSAMRKLCYSVSKQRSLLSTCFLIQGTRVLSLTYTVGLLTPPHSATWLLPPLVRPSSTCLPGCWWPRDNVASKHRWFLLTFSEHWPPWVPFASPDRGDIGPILVKVHHVRLVNLIHDVIYL